MIIGDRETDLPPLLDEAVDNNVYDYRRSSRTSLDRHGLVTVWTPSHIGSDPHQHQFWSQEVMTGGYIDARRIYRIWMNGVKHIGKDGYLQSLRPKADFPPNTPLATLVHWAREGDRTRGDIALIRVPDEAMWHRQVVYIMLAQTIDVTVKNAPSATYLEGD